MGMCIVWCVALYLLEARQTDAKITQAPSLVLERGRPAHLSCQQTDGHESMFWYRQDPGQGLQLLFYFQLKDELEKGKELSRFQASRPRDDLFQLNISSVQPEDTAVYFCASETASGSTVYFGEGTRLTVLEDGLNSTTPSVVIFPPSKQEIKEKGKATLVCLATDYYPDHINVVWRVNGEERKDGVSTDESLRDEKSKKYSLTSRLRISAQEWFNPKNKFQCSVEFHGNETEKFEPVLDGEAGCSVTEESYLRSAKAGQSVYVLLICKSVLYGVFVMWLMLRNKQVY